MDKKLDDQVPRLRPHAFEDFYAAEVDDLYRTLALVLRDADLAHEAVDEAMARAFQRWNKIRTYENPTGWVYRVAMNWALSRLRRRKREVLQLPEGSVSMPPIPDQALIDAVMALPLRFREVVILRYLLDWSEEATASSLSIPKGTVKSRLHRALGRLREELS
jgi:RNA polymerase sigma-70 factor (sigma-E family)